MLGGDFDEAFMMLQDRLEKLQVKFGKYNAQVALTSLFIAGMRK